MAAISYGGWCKDHIQCKRPVGGEDAIKGHIKKMCLIVTLENRNRFETRLKSLLYITHLLSLDRWVADFFFERLGSTSVSLIFLHLYLNMGVNA